MFQFSPLAPRSLWIQEWVTEHDLRRVSPFGHPRINAYVRLPEAFRSLSRLLRLSVPRHPPCALDSLDRIFRARRFNDVAFPRPTDSQFSTHRLVLSRLSRR